MLVNVSTGTKESKEKDFSIKIHLRNTGNFNFTQPRTHVIVLSVFYDFMSTIIVRCLLELHKIAKPQASSR